MADIGWAPNAWIAEGKPIVLFEPQGAGWKVQAIHTSPANQARCAMGS